VPFLLTNAFLLTALAGLGIPVLIHLLLKRRNQKLKFSTLRFFEAQDTRSSSRRRLRNLFLLLLRLLIFALIVLAFTRPFLPNNLGGTASRPRRQVVVVLDRSLSLTAKDSGGNRWDAALKAARGALGALGNDDRAALVGAAARSEVIAPFAPAPVTAQKLSSVTARPSTSDLGDALREAARLIANSDDAFESSIVVVSDLQRSGAETLGAVTLPKDVAVTFLPVGEAIAPNFAVTGLQLSVSETNTPFATVSNFGDVDGATTAEFRLDGKPVWTRAVPLPSGGVSNLDVMLPKLSPGWHDAEVRLKGGDSLADDDVRHATFLVPAPVRVLVVENRTEVRSFEEQSFFVLAALDPFFGGTNAGTGRFTVEQIRPEGVAAKLRNGKTATPGTRTAAFDVVILPALKTLPAEAVGLLSTFVKAGGGLFLFGGEALASSRFNAEFAGLLPVQVGEPVKADEELPWRIGDFDRTSPIFGVFTLEGGGTPGTAEFTRRHGVQPGVTATVLARFDDGIPFLLGATAGTGRLLFANTSADTAWTDWPKHKSFVPWLSAATAYLAGRTEDRLLESGREFATGTEAVLSAGAKAGKTPFTLRHPDGTESSLTASPEGLLAFEAERPGIHGLRDDTGREWLRFAVNVPSQESDLNALNVGDAGRKIVHQDTEGSRPAGLFGGDRQRQEFWRLLLLSALLLLFAETLISNRTTA
jgi:hypothetical protein